MNIKDKKDKSLIINIFYFFIFVSLFIADRGRVGTDDSVRILELLISILLLNFFNLNLI